MTSGDSFLAPMIRRYGTSDISGLKRLLIPQLIPVSIPEVRAYKSLGKGNHFRIDFHIDIEKDFEELMVPGTTGKFVPLDYAEGTDNWRELAKGRIISVGQDKAVGEIYLGSNGGKGELEDIVRKMGSLAVLEVDQFGASAKILSGLAEYSFAENAKREGFVIRRMPADIAKHIGGYYYFDYSVEKNGISKRVEIKSIWGTNTKYARLIASLSKTGVTSSPRFDSQDIFAVSLFLRTGNISDFAYALSVSEKEDSARGLPVSSKSDNHVHQNPICNIDGVKWFSSLSELYENAFTIPS